MLNCAELPENFAKSMLLATLFSVSNRFCSIGFHDFHRSIDGHTIKEYVCRV